MYYYKHNQLDDDSLHKSNEAPKMIDEYGNEQKTGRNGFASYLATWQVFRQR